MIFITFIPNVLSFSIYIKQACQFPLEALIKVGIEVLWESVTTSS